MKSENMQASRADEERNMPQLYQISAFKAACAGTLYNGKAVIISL
jgi:hypothetical protein